MDKCVENAPVVIFAYNRPECLRANLDSLRCCDLIESTSLYIFCDGVKETRSNDRELVGQVRKIARGVLFSRTLEVIERESNLGLHNSVTMGVKEILERHERAIFLEDDLVFARNFLLFMNAALNKYSAVPEVLSVTGYCPKLMVPNDYTRDAFFFRRSSSWGWGTWRHAWAKFDPYKGEIAESYNDPMFINLLKQGGEDLPEMLRAQVQGRISSWGVEWAYVHRKLNVFCVYPVQSLLYNTGFGESATHTRKKSRYAPELCNEKFSRKNTFNFPVISEIDERICLSFLKLFKPTIFGRVRRAYYSAIAVVK